METIYAIRQSSKGRSDIIYVCRTEEEAKEFCEAFYKDQEERQLKYKANWRVEPITLLSW